MTKKHLIIVTIAFAVCLGGYNVYQKQEREMMSDTMLANIEALANDEIVDKCQGCATYYLGRKCCTLIWPGHLETITLYHDYN